MASDARYSPFDHGGLEVAYNQSSGPEVVKDHTTAPEVVVGSNPPHGNRSSLDQPESLHPGQYEQQYGAYDQTGNAPPYTAGGSAYYAASGKEGTTTTPYALESGKNTPAQSQEPKRYCGTSKKMFVIILIIGLFVILAAVLGGVLGGVLGSHHNSDNSESSPSNSTSSGSGNGVQPNSTSNNAPALQALSNTGLASMIDGDGSGRLVTYYQDSTGRIIENSFLNGQWSLSNSSSINSSVVTNGASLGTSIAAVSYNLTGKTWRQIFFLNSQGYVQTVNSSSRSNGISTNWTSPVTIARDRAVSSSIAMAACADTTPGGMTGIRMYYGSQNKTIQEVGYNFSAPQNSWIEWMQFPSSDYNSGVDCTLYNTGLDRYISVYFRNLTTGTVEQQIWNYRWQNGWSNGPYTDTTVATGSDIAACTDGQVTDYVFYQIPGGTVTRAMVQPAGTSQFLGYANQQTATIGTRLSAAFVNGGSLYMFQNASSSSTMWAQDISRSGAVISDIAIS